jgi:pyruvate,water dikinase
MTRPFILALSQCTDPDLAGGKAVGLAQLIAAGFSVPHGVCLTTEAYRQSLHASGFIDHEMWLTVCRLPDNERRSALARCRDRINEIEISQLTSQWVTALETLCPPPDERWAVRSSATNERIRLKPASPGSIAPTSA